MTKYLLAILIMMTTLNAFSQSNSNYNYSIGVRAYSYQQIPKILDQSNNKTYLNTVANSYFAKFNDNLLSYRIGGAFINQTVNFTNFCSTCDGVNGHVNDFTVKVGFEKKINYGLIQPYVGIDLGYRSNKFEGTSRNINILKQTQAQQSNTPLPQSSVLVTKEGFIFSPVFGIKVTPLRQLSLFVETNLDFYYSREKQEMVTLDAVNTRSIINNNKFETMLTPVSIGLQFNFGEK